MFSYKDYISIWILLIENLAIIDFREWITNALIRLLGCSDRSIQSSLYLYCLHATKPDWFFFDGMSAICMISLQYAIPVSKHQIWWLHSVHPFWMFIYTPYTRWYNRIFTSKSWYKTQRHVRGWTGVSWRCFDVYRQYQGELWAETLWRNKVYLPLFFAISSLL